MGCSHCTFNMGEWLRGRYLYSYSGSEKNTKAADAVQRAMPHSKVYGWPKFFKMYLEKIYGRE